MPGTVDDLMSIEKIRPILAAAKHGPVPIALALLPDKTAAAVIVMKKGGPKKALRKMKADSKKNKVDIETSSLRFGTAAADPEKTGLLMVTLNKMPNGPLAMKARERLRKALWTSVEFTADAALENAPEEEDDEEESAEDGQHATAPQEPEPQPTAAAAPEPEQTSTQAPPSANAVIYDKSREAWLKARTKVSGDLDKLKAEIIATFKDEPGLGTQIDSAYTTQVAVVLQTLDERLAHALADASGATGDADRVKHVAAARAVMGEYAQFLGSSKLVTDLDTNPFLPVAIKATIGGTLAALSKAVR